MSMVKSKRLTKSRSVTLPKDLCEYSGFAPGEAIDITVNEDGSITIRKHAPVCRFCGDRLNAKSYKGVDLCPSCADELAKAVIS